MSFRWLKPYMPRSLYGRAILILMLPVVTVTLVVSVVFIQRHFEGVTGQMTNSVSRELELMLESGLNPQELARSRLSKTLLIQVQPMQVDAVPRMDERRWYDFTGAIVVRDLRRLFPDLAAIHLPDDQNVRLFFISDNDAFQMSFDRRRVSASNPHQLLVNMVFFAVLMTVIAYFYLRNQLRPITRLARAAEAFGRGHTLDYRPAGAVEVKAAGRSFLYMRERIDRQIEQRTLMLSGVSHDLRTPLTRLKLGLAMLEGDEKQAMERDLEDMERLITEFLDFARGAQQGEMKETDPMALVRQIADDAIRAGRDVTLATTEGQGRLMLRADAIRRAVDNLLSNAVRYGTRAELSAWLTEDELRIRIEDDGPGIPADQRLDAMKPFARLDTSRNQDLGSGVGLGLAIASDIARNHGGGIELGDSARLGGLQADIVISRQDPQSD